MTASVLSTTTAPTLEHASSCSLLRGRAQAALAVAFGVALTLAMQGYQFGRSNHTVYLIDALRHAQPHLLQNDWFATQTLHYHAAFGLLTRALMKLGIIEPAFLVGHLALAVLLHAAWWRIVRALGGGAAAFLLSEILFHVSGAGTGLGMYQFLQDSAFLPSNIASVAMLWGIYLWIVGRRAWAAVLFGIGGLFHLNYAIVAPFVWVVLAAIAWLKDRRRPTLLEWLGAIAMLELCLMNVVPALLVVSQRSGKMPLEQFVEIYVNLRHPHHYAPRTWPTFLWLSFLWPLPLAWIHWYRHREENEAVEQARRTVDVILLLLAVAFLGAGVWYVSETLVQLSLWRFSVFVKLLTCAAAAIWIVEMLPRHRRLVAGVSAALGVALIAACVVRGPYLGFFKVPDDDAGYLAACDWVRANTPADAIFLVPPDEQAFRLRAQRAIVVNFKCVPQLSAEIPEWHERLRQILGSAALDRLPVSFDEKRAMMRNAYESKSPEHLAKVAQHYNARYIVVGHRLGDEWEPRRVAGMNDATPAYFLYDLQR